MTHPQFLPSEWAPFVRGSVPQTLIFDIAAGATIAAANLMSTQQIVSVVVFIILASLTVGILVVWFLIASESARAKRETLRGWLGPYNGIVMGAPCLMLSVKRIVQWLPACFQRVGFMPNTDDAERQIGSRRILAQL